MWAKLRRKQTVPKKRTNVRSSHPQHRYFKGHECAIPPQKQTKYNTDKCRQLWKCILYLTAVRNGDVRARYMFKSYAALLAEEYRQYKHFPMSIHPYSRLRLAVEIFSTLYLQSCTFTVTWYFLQPVDANYCKVLIKICEALNLFNILVNFFTGYIEGCSSKFVVLDLTKIAWKYIKTWLIVDILFSSSLLFYYAIPSGIRSDAIADAFKIVKVPVIFHYTENFLEVIEASETTRIAVETALIVLNYLLWTMIFQYSFEFIVENTRTPSSPRNCSWLTITELWNATNIERKISALNRAMGMLQQNSNLNLLEDEGCFEAFFVLTWRTGKVIVIHCAIKCMLMLIGLESAKARYFIMTQQLQLYMDHRRFPDRIKKKILKFYAVRFQSHFFVEHSMMDCVSGRLREDIIMHSGRQLVGEVEFLKQMPRSLLLKIGVKLKLVIFLAGDIIFKINTVGDCFYFIDKGTVAIYSESGQEICHLQDGEFFGEIALVVQPQFRTASAVAVTNCELFRLDKKDFDSTIAIYPTVYENIKKVAYHRLERTIVIDEHHKSELSTGIQDPEV